MIDVAVDRFRKILALLRFLLFKVFIKESHVLNYRYENVFFACGKNVKLGKENVFEKYVSIKPGYIKEQKIIMGDANRFSEYSLIMAHGGYVLIGNENFFGERVQIQGRGGVEIGDRCMIAANTFISSSNHDFHDPLADSYLRKEVPAKTTIEDFVWIGANSVILAGVTIGHHSIVGAGTIVSKDVEPYSMIVGNPGKIIKKFSFDSNEWVNA